MKTLTLRIKNRIFFIFNVSKIFVTIKASYKLAIREREGERIEREREREFQDLAWFIISIQRVVCFLQALGGNRNHKTRWIKITFI